MIHSPNQRLAHWLFASLLVTLFTLASAHAATLTVANTNDSGVGSLRQAVIDAAGSDTINFAPGLSGGTITLASVIAFNKNLTIDGSSLPSQLTISGNNATQIFDITGGTVALNNLTVANGYAFHVNGGAIAFSGGALTLSNTTFKGNTAVGAGGAISGSGSITIDHCTFSNNSISGGGMPGGAIYFGGSSLTVTNSTFAGNLAGSPSDVGSAIALYWGTMVGVNNTFSGNSTPNNPTGGIVYSNGTLTMRNSLFAGNTGQACAVLGSVSFTIGSDNLADDATCGSATQRTAGQINLGALANNGGLTQTMALPSGSSALSAGNIAYCPATDQRGMQRPTTGHCDVGAYQYQTMTANASTTPQSAFFNTAYANALAVTVQDASNTPIPGVSVTFTAPGSGASVTPATATVVTNASGIASTAFTANAVAGTFNVAATATGLGTVNFALTNNVSSPTVTSVSPSSGPPSGGTSVLISGTHFTGATAVSFSGSPASSFTVDSDTQITATAPVHPSGLVDITVTTPSGTSATGANDQFTYALSSQAVTFAPTASVTLGAAPVVLSASSTSGLTSFTFATSSSASICTVTGSTVTFVGTGTCALTATQPGNAQYASAMASANVVINAAPVPEPSVLIPTFSALQAIPGLGARPSILDLSAGSGPAMVVCLSDTVRAMLGGSFAYLGQNADGSVRFGNADSFVSVYPLSASSTGQQPGFYPQGSNLLQVGTSCGGFTVAPALYSLREFGAFLNAFGLVAHINAQGVFTLTVGGTVYVFRPEYVVTHVVPTGAASLVIGADGVYRFTDSAGNVQRLLPAFLDPEVLSNQVAQAVSGSTVIQPDGTVWVTLLGGQQFVLTPNLTLSSVSPEFLAASWWQDGALHYQYRLASVWLMSQGFTVAPKP